MQVKPEYLQALEESAALSKTFFDDTIKNFNVGDSFLSCDDITNWNDAALAAQKANAMSESQL